MRNVDVREQRHVPHDVFLDVRRWFRAASEFARDEPRRGRDRQSRPAAPECRAQIVEELSARGEWPQPKRVERGSLVMDRETFDQARRLSRAPAEGLFLITPCAGRDRRCRSKMRFRRRRGPGL